MTFTKHITIDRTAAGAADYTSNNPPLPVYSDSDNFVTLTWGDNAVSIDEGATGQGTQSLQTKYKVDNFDGIVLFEPIDNLINAEDSILLYQQVWNSAPAEIILYVSNLANAAGNLDADVLLGYLRFIDPIYKSRKIVNTLA